VAVGGQVLLDQRVEHLAAGGEVAVGAEDVAQGAVLFQDPGMQGLDEGVAVDEVELEGEDAEEQVAVRSERSRAGVGHGGVPRAREKRRDKNSAKAFLVPRARMYQGPRPTASKKRADLLR
jgi:hypothetical protein